MTIRVKRIYEPVSTGDGRRYLVDRMWPRGISRENAAIDDWLRELGPSHELRRWFGHDPARWPEFKRRYFEELSSLRALWAPLVAEARTQTVTLLFSARDETRNQAVALAELLRRRSRRAQKK